MSENTENLKNSINEVSKKLTKIGTELAGIRFSYKVEEKPSKEYWESRIKEFKRYNEKCVEYYSHVYYMINLYSKEESQMFLLRTSKFRQLGSELLEIMQKIKDNPSITDSKDKQQSQWSKEIRKELTEQSNKCLDHERKMNASFRDFYQNELKKKLE